MTSPILNLTEMAASQSQPSVIVNDHLRALEVFGQIIAETQGDTAPPGSPADGDQYILGTSCTGAWSGHDLDVAYYSGGWKFLTPTEGWRAFNVDDGEYYRYTTTGPAWNVDSTTVPALLYVTGIPFAQPGLPGAGAVYNIMLPFACTIAAALAGSYGYSGVNATSSSVFSLAKNGAAAFGTLTWTNASSAPTLASGSGATFAAGDRLTITAPASQDATLADVGFTLKATRI